MPLTADETAAYMALLEGSSLLFQAVDQHLQREAGITHAQFEILSRLALQPDGLRMTDLAAQVLLSRSGLTYQAAQMERLGLIERIRSDADERCILARVTPDGAALFERLLPAHVTLVRESLFSRLKPGEAETVAAALARVAAGLRG